MKIVLEWLFTLKTHFMPNTVGYSFSDTFSHQFGNDISPKWKVLGERFVNNGENVQKDDSPRASLSLQRSFRGTVMTGVASNSSLNTNST